MIAGGVHVKLKKSLKDQYVSQVGFVLLETLIGRKNSEKSAEKFLQTATLATLACLGLGVAYIILNVETFNFLSFLSNLYLFAFITLFAVCSFITKYAKKKLDKAEKEYEELRYEIIDRQEELWDTRERWQKRHELFEWLAKEYDVNLFHK